eukprot:gene67920-93058_t
MLADVPVIGAGAGAASVILEAGKAGTLVPPGDADALAAAIAKIMSRPPELADQLQYADARARSHYGIAQMLQTPRHSTRRFTAILISGALTSKLLGFGREILMAQVLGASLVADGFRGAITAVMLPLAFLQNETVPAVMIPMHRDALKNGNAPQRLGAMTVALTGIAVILMIALQIL